MKYYLKIIGIILLVVFSIIYSSFASFIIKYNDPIMKKINDVKDNYNTSYTNAVFMDNYMIPGISGKKVDIDKSYNLMKKYGGFNEKLIVFEDNKPKKSIVNKYNKYIFYGNQNRNNISFIYDLKNENNIDKIINILNENNVYIDFIVDDKSLLDSLSNYEINISNVTNKIDKFYKYCILDKPNDTLLNICVKNKRYTFIPGVLVKDNLYNKVKDSLKPGLIIKINDSIKNIKELSITINYLRQKGYNIVSLSELIKE